MGIWNFGTEFKYYPPLAFDTTRSVKDTNEVLQSQFSFYHTHTHTPHVMSWPDIFPHPSYVSHPAPQTPFPPTQFLLQDIFLKMLLKDSSVRLMLLHI